MMNNSTNEMLVLQITAQEELKLPLLDGLSAGFPSPARDYMEDSIDLNKELIRNPNWTFMGRVEGESMKGAGIDNGDLVVIDRSLDANHGRIALCCLNGGFTIKRIHKTPEKLLLMPANPQYKPIDVSENNSFSVWGVVTYVIKKV